jgi:hypothetical protein
MKNALFLSLYFGSAPLFGALETTMVSLWLTNKCLFSVQTSNDASLRLGI